MIINRILEPKLTLSQAPGNSKKRVLENIAELIHQHNNNIDAEDLFKLLTARERLGSTAIGHGIAIPHCRSAQVTSTIGCLVKLKDAIGFDAHDDLPVDIIFVLIVPENATDEHLNTLAELAELLEQASYRNSLRQAQTSEELYNAATHFEKAA
jgi:nitrogen PTS system EIIA component